VRDDQKISTSISCIGLQHSIAAVQRVYCWPRPLWLQVSNDFYSFQSDVQKKVLC